MEMVAFASDDIANSLANLSESQLDELAFGAVQLDADGNIIAYNAVEGDITGRDPKSVIGKNFFTDVAPCTNQPEFRGKFEDGVRQGKLNSLFEWTFDYNMTPTKVQVHMKSATLKDRYWIFVKRL